jgi:hypothetical protein
MMLLQLKTNKVRPTIIQHAKPATTVATMATDTIRGRDRSALKVAKPQRTSTSGAQTRKRTPLPVKCRYRNGVTAITTPTASAARASSLESFLIWCIVSLGGRAEGPLPVAKQVVMWLYAVGGALAVRAEKRLQSAKGEHDSAAPPGDLVMDHAHRHRMVAMEFRVATNCGSRPPVTSPDFDARDVPEVVVEVARNRCVRLAHC